MDFTDIWYPYRTLWQWWTLVLISSYIIQVLPPSGRIWVKCSTGCPLLQDTPRQMLLILLDCDHSFYTVYRTVQHLILDNLILLQLVKVLLLSFHIVWWMTKKMLIKQLLFARLHTAAETHEQLLLHSTLHDLIGQFQVFLKWHLAKHHLRTHCSLLAISTLITNYLVLN